MSNVPSVKRTWHRKAAERVAESKRFAVGTDIHLLEMALVERERVRNLLADLAPLMAECDCIHSDDSNPVQCPCKRLRAELERP